MITPSKNPTKTLQETHKHILTKNCSKHNKTQGREYTTEADEARGLFHVKVNTAHQTREANLHIMALDVKKTYIMATTIKGVQDTLISLCVNRSPYTWSPPQGCPLVHNCTHTACSGLAVMDYINKKRE